jgi:hypothetical protein
MEHKIKKLVDNISVAASTPRGAGTDPAIEQRLAREVSALQRLVNAAVAALRNSEAERGAGGAAPPNTPGTAGGAARGSATAPVNRGGGVAGGGGLAAPGSARVRVSRNGEVRVASRGGTGAGPRR